LSWSHSWLFFFFLNRKAVRKLGIRAELGIKLGKLDTLWSWGPILGISSWGLWVRMLESWKHHWEVGTIEKLVSWAVRSLCKLGSWAQWSWRYWELQVAKFESC
jgi:hypothetical protein